MTNGASSYFCVPHMSYVFRILSYSKNSRCLVSAIMCVIGRIILFLDPISKRKDHINSSSCANAKMCPPLNIMHGHIFGVRAGNPRPICSCRIKSGGNVDRIPISAALFGSQSQSYAATATTYSGISSHCLLP